MKRLTQKNYLINGESEAYVYGGIEYYGDSYSGEVIDKLAEYEDLEEQGLLLRLPCKVGDTVYIIGGNYRCGREEYWINTGKFRLSDLDKIGKSVFLTKEEAEQALAQMKGVSMTENEAIKEIEVSLELAKMCTPNREREKEIKAYKMAIQALEKVQQFEAIGTIEEFKALKEKNEPKKVIRLSDNGYYDYKCPTCGMPDKDCMGKKYCDCGQALEA